MADDLRPNEMVWRFAHEDEEDNRTVISRNRKFNSVGRDHAHILLSEVIEDWADNEPGGWDHQGDNLEVIVLAPANMAGLWKVRVRAAACALAERQ